MAKKKSSTYELSVEMKVVDISATAIIFVNLQIMNSFRVDG
jgi:hypothetical protein